METLLTPGRIIFAIAIAALGAENLLCARVSQTVFDGNPPGVPVLPFVPATPLLAYLVGIVLLAVGVSVAANIRPSFAATFLGLFFLLYTLLHLVPIVVGRPRDLNARTGVFEIVALGASALTLAASLNREHASKQRSMGTLATFVVKSIHTLIASGPYLFATCSVVFGITHFLIPRFIASLVPGWIPGGLFWAYLTGASFIAAGVSIATGVMARWGAFWLGVMLLLWFLVLHAPRVAMHPRLPAEWSSMFEVLGMGGGAWIVASHSLWRRAQRAGKART